MKIPAILVTSLLVWGLASGRGIDSSAAASAQASASASASSIGPYGKLVWGKEEKKKIEGLGPLALNLPALKLGIKNGGLDVAKGAAGIESAMSDASTHPQLRTLDLGLGVIANSAEILAEEQSAASAKAGAEADSAVARSIKAMEIVDKAQYLAAIITTKAAKAAEATMAAVARANSAASASKLSSQYSNAEAANAVTAEAKANAASIIANKRNAGLAEMAAMLAATAAKANKSAIECNQIAKALAKAEARITEKGAEALIAISKAEAAVARAAADQAVCSSQAQAASQIQSRASASESAASAQSEINTAAAEAVAIADAKAASQAEGWVESLKKDLWMRLNMKGEAKSDGQAISKGHYGIRSTAESSAEASSKVSIGGWNPHRGRKDSVSEASAAASAASEAL